MGLKPGYEHSPVGVIPADWRVVDLASLIDPSRSIRYGIVQPGRFDQYGRYMVRGQDYSDGWADPSELFRVSPEVEERYANARVRAGDILITIVGASTGKIAVVPSWLDGANLTQTTARVAINSNKTSSSYCSHVLSSRYGAREVQNYIKGGAQPGLNCGDVEKFLIPLPPTRAEQERIAQVLDDVEALIHSLAALLTKERSVMQGAMAELLTGRRRLAGYAEPWRVSSFDGVLFRLNCKANQVQTSEYRTMGRHPIIDQGKEAVAGFSDREDLVFRCPEGGVIVFGDHTCVVKFIDFDFLVGADGTQILRAKGGQCTRFHAFQLQYRGIEPTGYNRHFKYLLQREFLVPTLPEQMAVAELLSGMNASIESLEARLAKTRDLKRAMAQELLSGRTRLE